MMLRTIGATLVFLALTVGMFGYAGSMASSHHSMGDGTSHHVCSFMGGSAGCVSPIQHLVHWAQSFSATLSLDVLVLLAIAVLLTPFLIALPQAPPILPHALLVRFGLLPRHALIEAFASGRIHPKIPHE